MANRKSNVPRITIVELKRKIELLLNNNVGGLCSQNALELSLQVGGGYISRLKDNMYADTFELLCTVYEEYVPKSLWYESYKVFEQELVKQGSIQLKPPSTSVHHGTRGICLKSVIKAVQDKENVENVFQVIKGYWELFSYSTFHTDKPTVSYTILEITKINEDGYIECVTDTKGFKREGVCFQLGEKLYFIFDKGLAPNELIFIIVNFLEYASQPKMNGIATFSAYHTNDLTSTKVVLHHIESIEILKNKYQVMGNSIPKLSKQIALVINSNLKLSNDIIDHIDNYVPFTATPYVLSAGKHYDSVAKRFHILADLESIINGFSEEEIVEKHCINDYLTLLKNALNNGVYRIVKFSQYYERIGLLAKNTTKTIIATYLYKNYNHDSPELISFSEVYLNIQAKLIKENNVLIHRLFIIENEEPDDFLLAKMRREKQLGIEVSYLCSKEWVEARLEHPMGILDFALFDSTKAIILGEKELFFGIQSASVIINQKEISSYIESFAINWKKANFLH